jgi:hypothetical protein
MNKIEKVAIKDDSAIENKILEAMLVVLDLYIDSEYNIRYKSFEHLNLDEYNADCDIIAYFNADDNYIHSKSEYCTFHVEVNEENALLVHVFLLTCISDEESALHCNY